MNKIEARPRLLTMLLANVNCVAATEQLPCRIQTALTIGRLSIAVVNELCNIYMIAEQIGSGLRILTLEERLAKIPAGAFYRFLAENGIKFRCFWQDGRFIYQVGGMTVIAEDNRIRTALFNICADDRAMLLKYF